MAFTMQRQSEPQNELMSALSTLHLSGRFSDLTIQCNDKQWAVHKAIVCSRSGFFDGVCSSSCREANTGVVDLSEDDQDAVDQMVHYFYYLDYMNQYERKPSPVFRHRALSDARRRIPQKLDLTQIEDPLLAQAGFALQQVESVSSPRQQLQVGTQFDHVHTTPPQSPVHKHKRSLTPPSIVPDLVEDEMSASEEEDFEDGPDESHLLLHTRVYALAEKFDIPGLKELARSKFEMAMACFYDSPQLADAIEEVYFTTIDSDRGLRDVVLQGFRTHPQLATTKDVYEVIEATPALAFELYKVERRIPI